MLNKAVYLRPAVLAASAVMIGCSSGNSEQFRQAPNYASPVDTDAWSVQCYDAQRREIIVMENRTSTFYKPDGTLKTRDEFCDENRTISRLE